MKNLTILTLNEPNVSDFAAARNTLLKTAKTDWVFFLDTDEVMTPELKTEITNICNLSSNIYSAYSVRRLDTFLGRELTHGEAGHTRLVRLARRTWGKWERPVHEKWVGLPAEARSAKVGELKNPLLHTPHSSISSFLAKIDRYSTLDAQYRYEQGAKSSLFKIFFYPLAKFKLNYLLRLGLLDGVPGLIHAMMMSFHSYLTWSKLYLLWHKH